VLHQHGVIDVIAKGALDYTAKPRRATAAKATKAASARSRKILESPAATSRRIERNIQRDTLGLGLQARSG
jgi:hypothetical protein